MVLKHILYGKSNQPTLKKSKIVWFSNKQGPIFLRTFLLERHKEINRRSTCAHFEQRSMRNPQRFEGLEEDEITWYSNTRFLLRYRRCGLEEDEITWYSNEYGVVYLDEQGLEEDEITWYSNWITFRMIARVGLERV